MSSTRCWFWHSWTKWKLADVVVYTASGVTMSVTYNVRTCVQCGKTQKELP